MVWEDGSTVGRKEEGLPNCKRICNARAECNGFDHDKATNLCGLWKRAPFKPEPRSGYDCYQKISGENCLCMCVSCFFLDLIMIEV